MYVVCTAGHVDHGKSTLVRALTGMEPDRFAEEQRRGLTIDIGFAWMTLPELDVPDPRVAFVDLPGHHRFIGNMLAGAGPIGTALFVVAADEGWMPQSTEHLAILDLLGVRHGLVTLTKADLVDDEVLEMAGEFVREELQGTALADADIVPVSAATGAGLDDLRRRLVALLTSVEPPLDMGRPRLWVDRSFVVHGAGTVVTGTLLDGWLRVGDEVAVVPGGHRGRVRGLQSLKETAEAVPPGSRVAVNISSVGSDQCPRGVAITHPGQWLETDRVDVCLRALPGQTIGRRGAWHVYIGSGERTARLWTLEGVDIDGESEGAEGFVHLELDQPAALCAGDRLILREAGRQATVAGGVIVDADPPPRPRGTAARLERIGALAARNEAVLRGDRAGLLRAAASDLLVPSLDRAASSVGLTREAAREAAEAHGLVLLGESVVGPERFAAWAEAVVGAVGAFLADNPVRRVAPKELAARAATAAGCPPAVVDDLLARLVADERLAAEVGGLRTPEHRVQLSPEEERAREGVLSLLDGAPFSPPSLPEIAAETGASVELLQEMELAGDLVRIEPDIAVSTTALDRAHVLLLDAYRAEGPLTASRAREVLGTSRKYALPLLQLMDRQGRTRREGDVRVVRPPGG